jgi:PAB-dependent poly(A)-specific ribonuclease subunit 3
VSFSPYLKLQLDAGSEEKIMLVARDEQSCLVVTFKEVKACIDSAFRSVLKFVLRGFVRF